MIMRKRMAVLLVVLLAAALAVPVSAMEASDGQIGIAFSDLFGSAHMVVLMDDFSGDMMAADGQNYTFRAVDSSFDYQIMAYMDGEPVNAIDNGDGSFTIQNVTGSLMISGRKIPKPAEKTTDTPPADPLQMQPQTPAVQQPTQAPQAPAEIVTVVTPTPQPEAVPKPAPEAPTEVPIPEEPVQEELVPEEPAAEPEPPVVEKTELPVAQPAPVEEPVEKEPFPWWMLAAAALGLGAMTALVLVLNRRTVTFMVEGGSAIQTQKVLKGRKAARPAEPEKDGAIFAGWFRDEARTLRWDFENTAVENHMTLYAKWLAVG